MQPIDIIINNFTRLQYLDALVKRIKERTEYPYRIIVVDNASTLKTQEFIEKLKEQKLIDEAVYNKENYPLPQSFKQAFDLVKSKYFVMTVDDTIPPFTKPCWLTHLVYLMENTNYGSIALKYRHCYSKDYIDGKNMPLVEIPLTRNNVEHKHAIEEFFQIQKTEDIKVIGFSRKNAGIYDYSIAMENKLGKIMGRTTKESGLVALAWDDDDLGYLEDVKNRKQYFDKKKFKNVKIIACLMAHHDDEFIDRLLENLSQFTDEFYINLNEASEYTAKVCKEHKYTRKIIETKNEKGYWSQMVQRENTIRMLDDVKPDIVLFPDTDELYCDNLKEVLAEFWDSNKNACWFEMKHCWGDENTVRLDGLFCKMVHVRVYKWIEGITYEKYKGYACPTNFYNEKNNKFLSKSPVKHLKFLKVIEKERVKNDKNDKNVFTKDYKEFDNNYGN